MRQKPLAIPDCVTLRKMWREGATIEAIASRFHVGTCVVDRARLRYGYPARSRGKLLGPMPAGLGAPDPCVRGPVKPAPAQRAGFGRWSTDQVAAVLQTQGRYSGLADLAARWDEQVVAVVGLWHRVRVS